MAPMLDLQVWIGAVPVFPIRQALTASVSAASARPSAGFPRFFFARRPSFPIPHDAAAFSSSTPPVAVAGRSGYPMKPTSALAGAQPGRNAGLRRWFRKRKLEKYDQRLSPKMCRFGARSRPFTQRRHGWRDLTRGNVVASHPMGNPTAETALAGTLEGFEPVCVDFETGLLASFPSQQS